MTLKPIKVWSAEVWQLKAARWHFTCMVPECATTQPWVGYRTAEDAADEGRAHLWRAHGRTA